MEKYVCEGCEWVYDEEVEPILFVDLPEDYTCPNCGGAKGAFAIGGFGNG